MKATQHGLKWWLTSGGRYGWACKRCACPAGYETSREAMFAAWALHKASGMHARSLFSAEKDAELVGNVLATIGLESTG